MLPLLLDVVGPFGRPRNYVPVILILLAVAVAAFLIVRRLKARKAAVDASVLNESAAEPDAAETAPETGDAQETPESED